MGKNQAASGAQQAQPQRQAYEDPNTLASRATARVLEVISEGEIEGFATSPVTDSIYFGDTPLTTGGSSNFNGVGLAYAYGTPDQSFLQGFPDVEAITAVDTAVTYYSPQYAGSGDGSVTRSITDTTVNAVRVTIRLPELFYAVPDFDALGKTPLYITWSGPKQTLYPGDIMAAELSLRVTVTDNLGVYKYADITIRGKTMSAYERSWRFDLFGTGPWTVKVARSSEAAQGLDWLEPYYRNQLIWGSYTEIKDLKLTYPDTAIVGMTIDSQTFGGSVDNRAYLIKGIKCQIPDNYDPITRTYTGVWAGTFRTAWTDNPAWVLYDLLTNTRYGLALTASQVDRWGLYSISQYCDELIPDGFGGLEPRYTCNGVINSRQEGFTLAQAIASIFRGQLYWKSGVVFAVADMPSDPVKLVTNANVIDGQFNYVGTSLKSRHTAAIVTYNDPNDLYRQAPVLVEDQDAISENGYNQLDIAAFMTTSKGQAYRQGLWALDTEKTETELVTYKAALDHADLLPGDLISLADNSYMGVRWGGRIREAVTAAKIHLDSTVTLAVGETYTLSAVMPDGTIQSRTVSDIPGTYSILNLSAGYSQTPIDNAMFTLASTTVEPRQFRVLSIREQDGIIFEVTALFHDPTKYDRIEQCRDLEGPSYSGYPTGLIAPVTGMDTRNYLYLSGSTPSAAVTLSWNQSTDPRTYRYDVYSRMDDQELIYRGSVTSPTIDITPVTDGWFTFSVTPIDSLGRRGVSAEIRRYLSALANPPANVSTFRIAIRDVEATLTWQAVEDVDLSHYEIRYSALTTGATWGAATILKNNIRSTTYTTTPLAGTYLIKAVDTSGTESVAATLLVVPAEYLKDLNVVETITESPDFLGAKTDVVVDGTDLIMDAAAGVYKTDGTYVFAGNPIDLGASYKNRVTPKITAYGDDAGYTLETWPALDTIADIFSANSGGWYAKLQQRITEGIGLLDVTETTATTIDAELTGSSAIGYDGTLFYLMNGSGAIYTSSDKGATWGQVTVSSSCWSTRTRAATLYYDSKIWVLGGFLKTDVWYTADQGVNWTEVTTIGSKWTLCTAGRACVYGEKIWVFDSDGHAYTTTDGATWTDEGDIGLVIMGIAVFGDKLVAICYDSVNFRADLVYESADGTTWTQLEDLPNPMDADGGGCIAVDDHVLVFTASGLYWLDPYATTPSWEFRETTVYNSSLNTQTMAIDEDFDAVWGRQYTSGMSTINSINTANLRYGTWSEWDDVEIATDYQARSFEFRLLMGTSSPGNLTPRIQALSVEIDMPDRIESAEDVAIGAGGETIVFTAPFRAIPAVTVTGQDLATGDYAVISNKSVSGFTLQFKDSGGSGVARTADWIARGYGRVS